MCVWSVWDPLLKGGGVMSRSCWCAQAGHQMSLCVEHMACCLFGAMCSHVDCLSPPILLLNHCFSGSSCVSLVTLVCLLYSLLMSAILCWSVVFRVSYVTCEFCVWLRSSLLPACLFFPFGVFFVVLFFILLLKKPDKSLHLSPRPHLSWHN